MTMWTTNAIVIALALSSCWLQYELWRLVRSKAFVILGVGMAYLVVFRIFLPGRTWMSAYGLVLPFYVLVNVHSIMLYRAILRVLSARGGEG